MGYLLSLETSTRAEASWSSKALAVFEEHYLAAHPGATIRRRHTQDIPHLDFLAQLAGRTPIDQHTPELTQAWALADELTTELLGADALVIATPMYNWGPPSALKAWIDRIINVRTFYTPDGSLATLPVTVIVASGGLYSEGDNVVHDHLRPLLRECFTRVGITDLVFVNCDPAGALDRGAIHPDTEHSAWHKAVAAIPAAAQRSRSFIHTDASTSN